jgi:hypothetical protein
MQEDPQAEEGGADTMGQTDRLNAPPQASGVILRYPATIPGGHAVTVKYDHLSRIPSCAAVGSSYGKACEVGLKVRPVEEGRWVL